jgi:hypothetical protein
VLLWHGLMNDFEINIDQILNFNSVDEFIVWFDTVDEFVEFENVDTLLSELAVLDKPDYYMYVYYFKQQYLNK